VRPDDADAFI
jgi:tetratricopeptide (TPR) repeat protein